MKKLLVFGMAALLVVAFSLPASALENQFGGYWRVRGYTQQEFDGSGTGAQDVSQLDTRTRLYWTAILNDNLKLVNKFEMDAVFGRPEYGDFGADGVAVEVKNTYADFITGPVEWMLGVQGAAIGRSLVFDNDFAGAVAVYRADRWWLRGSWLKNYEGGVGDDANDQDYDALALEASISLGEGGSIRPYFVYSWSKEFIAPAEFSPYIPSGGDDADVSWIGLDADFNLGPVVLFGSAGYVFGESKGALAGQDADITGYVLLLGGSVPLGPASINFEGFYASGDDDPTDTDIEGWAGLSDSYYWAEIMGYGVVDNQVSAGSPADKLNNIYALNLGASIKPYDKLSISGDLWFASKVEKDPITDEKDLGLEADLRITYELVEGLNLDLIGAYLWAGDATAIDANGNDKNPYELAFQTSLSF
jgi:hypothetical protein